MSQPTHDEQVASTKSLLLEGVRLVPLRRIESPAGAVMHGLKASEPAFQGFGEAYFTTVGKGRVKAWKRHRQMASNLIVPVGEIRLKLFDDRDMSLTRNRWMEVILGSEHYQRLTLPAGLWFGFEGLAEGLNLMLNLASIEHDPGECDTLALHDPRFAQSGW
jgi:dTDP-4-dehydrorhamnose 3,5-epimerase